MSEAKEVFKASSKIFEPFPKQEGPRDFFRLHRDLRIVYAIRDEFTKRIQGNVTAARIECTTEEKKRLYTHRDKNQHNAPLSKTTCILTDELATVEENGSAQHTM